MLRSSLALLVSVLATAANSAAAPATTASTQPAARAVIDVWPSGKMPGKPTTRPESERPPTGDGFHRVTDVSRPTLAFFPATATDAKLTDAKSTPPANAALPPTVIVCPGGGYSYLVIDKEGSEIAQWLNSNGVSAVVLKYRVPNQREGALQDIQRAISVVRAHAAEWKIDPHRIGVIGFSAGGNLAAKASTLFDQRAYPTIDATDEQSCRPDFAMLVYPAYLEKNGKLTPDLNLKVKIPPTLIVHSEDDKRFVAGSKLYHAALDEAKVPNQFLLYPTGGHGYALHCTKEAKAWPAAAMEWLGKMGMR